MANWWRGAALWLAAGSVFILLLRELKSVLLPFVFALFLFYLLDPVTARLSRRLPRPLSVFFVLLAAAGILVGGVAVAGRGAATIAGNFEKLEESSPKFRELARKARPKAEEALAGAGSAAGGTLLVFAYLAFLLVESPRARKRWSRAFPGHADRIVEVLDAVESRMVRFVWLQTLVSLGTAAVFWAILVAHGVKAAAFWGLLNFLSQYVPNIGPIVSSLPPILMTLLDSEPKKALSLGVWLLASQFLIGNFAEPKIIGHGTRLDPISVLLGIVFFGWLWGLAGSFLAVPILIAVTTACGSLPSLKPVAGLLQGTESGKKG